jgi:SAM-dependent methyltransferase
MLDMTLYKYDSLESYKEIQIRGSDKTANASWVKESSMELLASLLKERLGSVSRGLCHGTRQGNEQLWLSRELNADVLGTDLSSLASQNANTIEWDFHEVRDDWIGTMDFVYSNSLDHSYDPDKAISAWLKCVRPGGYVILHWSSGHTTSNARDPFGATLDWYENWLNAYNLEEIVEDEDETKRFLFVRSL